MRQAYFSLLLIGKMGRLLNYFHPDEGEAVLYTMMFCFVLRYLEAGNSLSAYTYIPAWRVSEWLENSDVEAVPYIDTERIGRT